MASHPNVMGTKERLNEEISLLTDKIAQLKTATFEERSEVFRQHHERVIDISETARNERPAQNLTSSVSSRAGSAAEGKADSGRLVVEALQALFEQHKRSLKDLATEAGFSKELESGSLDMAEAAASAIGSGVMGKPLTVLHCANALLPPGHICEKLAALVCGACHLVSYCSRECQREHWKEHKKECKHSDAGPGREPQWIKEMRRPGWMIDGPCTAPPPREHLWGNTPAFSLLGPPDSQASQELLAEKQEIKLCFAAARDLRNVVSTIVGLPVGFDGKVRILINDFSPKIACRNFLILQILSQLGKRGLDLAIAVWYSLAITKEQSIAVSVLALRLDLQRASDEGGEASWASKNNRSVIEAHFEKSVWSWLFAMLQSPLTLQAADDQRSAILRDPARRDFVEKMRACFEPYHRVSIERFTDFGLLLPYGAFIAHHDNPNNFLLDPLRGYTMDVFADPREGWDFREILAAGAKHRVPKNDLYGALFFMLRDKLAAVIERMETAEITFELVCEGASNLAARMKVAGGMEDGSIIDEETGASGKRTGSEKGEEKQKKALMPAGVDTPLLHRVDVSNICDPNYVGITRVLQDWGPLLLPGGVLVGLLMNWTVPGLGGGSWTMGEDRSPDEDEAIWRKLGELSLTNPAKAALLTTQMNFVHDFSEAFDKYLEQHEAFKEAETQRLSRRDVHQIVAPRFGIPVGASKKSLPIEHIKTGDDWYWGLFANGLTGTEVYTEWVKQ